MGSSNPAFHRRCRPRLARNLETIREVTVGLYERILKESEVTPGSLRLVRYLVQRTNDLPRDISMLAVVDHKIELRTEHGEVIHCKRGMTEDQARDLYYDLIAQLEEGA